MSGTELNPFEDPPPTAVEPIKGREIGLPDAGKLILGIVAAALLMFVGWLSAHCLGTEAGGKAAVDIRGERLAETRVGSSARPERGDLAVDDEGRPRMAADGVTDNNLADRTRALIDRIPQVMPKELASQPHLLAAIAVGTLLILLLFSRVVRFLLMVLLAIGALAFVALYLCQSIPPP